MLAFLWSEKCCINNCSIVKSFNKVLIIENADCNNGYDMLYCIYYTLMAYIFIFNDLLLGFFVNCWCTIFLHYVIILLWFYIKYYFMYYVICYVPIAHIIHKKEPFFTNAKPNKCSIHSTSVEKCHLLQLKNYFVTLYSHCIFKCYYT